ncbi:GyrI-like domain-containing protein [Rhodococcus sp. AG1013]|uniref:GyrI-like domain-containing protein n=1 Tax=unclassified Rhodococcus (in: high G+C Gram-positive bacteria) TaxID=192944 RepID=UPI000E0B1C01|nr:GyrI-like domain-containing protein [Rhodococcus sp. AG1013]RDI35544.1 effector-binding domain-containing protein [Rhodococcus sp. AG1013]
MSDSEIVVKPLPGLRVAELTGVAAGFDPEHVGPVVKPLFDELMDGLARDGVRGIGPALAYYERTPAGADVVVHAAIPVGPDERPGRDFAVVDLPEIPRAATLEHRGSMENVLPAWASLEHWIEANGYRADGPARERYLVYSENTDDWVTELQRPVTRD